MVQNYFQTFAAIKSEKEAKITNPLAEPPVKLKYPSKELIYNW